ncbi:MAG TPA: hypothetical protein EYN67_06490 [Flavobacteriales bacterium]|nr:hypothetical protein [Flavobacteriales bacterium]
MIRVRDFDPSSASDFSEQMRKAHNTGQTMIPIIIDSYGGQVYSLLSMVSDIKNSRLPVATIVQGKAMSCGAMLFSFGNPGMRYMDQDATLMIHDVSSMAWGKVEEVKADAAEAERLNQKLYHAMAENCGKSKNYFLTQIHERGHADWYLEADEALEHNLTTTIGVPSVEVSVTVDMKIFISTVSG